MWVRCSGWSRYGDRNSGFSPVCCKDKLECGLPPRTGRSRDHPRESLEKTATKQPTSWLNMRKGCEEFLIKNDRMTRSLPPGFWSTRCYKRRPKANPSQIKAACFTSCPASTCDIWAVDPVPRQNTDRPAHDRPEFFAVSRNVDKTRQSPSFSGRELSLQQSILRWKLI